MELVGLGMELVGLGMELVGLGMDLVRYKFDDMSAQIKRSHYLLISLSLQYSCNVQWCL